jgi:hypothetical protein
MKETDGIHGIQFRFGAHSYQGIRNHHYRVAQDTSNAFAQGQRHIRDGANYCNALQVRRGADSGFVRSTLPRTVPVTVTAVVTTLHGAHYRSCKHGNP